MMEERIGVTTALMGLIWLRLWLNVDLGGVVLGGLGGLKLRLPLGTPL